MSKFLGGPQWCGFFATRVVWSWYGVQNASKGCIFTHYNSHEDIWKIHEKIVFWKFGIFPILTYFYVYFLYLREDCARERFLREPYVPRVHCANARCARARKNILRDRPSGWKYIPWKCFGHYIMIKQLVWQKSPIILDLPQIYSFFNELFTFSRYFCTFGQHVLT